MKCLSYGSQLGMALLLAASSASASTVFNDTFGSSTLDSASPGAPSGTSTSYELISSKSRVSPSIASGDLKFGIAATTSGSIEAQGLFSTTPYTLATVGDSITLTVVFTDTSGILTQSGFMGFGLYDSGQNTPVASGLNGTAVNNQVTAATGAAQLWAGYVGQISFTGGNSRIMNRYIQGAEGNNAQDLITSGSTSTSGSSYANLGAATVGPQNVAGVTLTAATQYTEVLNITLAAGGIHNITNTLFAGNGTGGTQLTQFGGATTAGTFVTNSFDSLALGYRATANTSATAIDVNQILVDFTGSPVPEPTTVALTGLGIAGFVLARRRMKR